MNAGIPTYAKYAAAVAAGMVVPNLIQGLTGQVGTTMGSVTPSPWTWGTAQAPVNPGANPGLIAGQVEDFYNNPQGSLADTYYWGVHNPLSGTQNIAQQYNTDANAPVNPYGTAYSTMGGNEELNIPQFIQNTIGSPSYQKMTGSSGPYYAAPETSAALPSSYYTAATQSVSPWIGTSFGGPSVSPLGTIINPTLNTTAPVAPAGATNAGAPTAG
jgi:hypothetical protein